MNYATSPEATWLVFGFAHIVMAIALWKMAKHLKEEPAWFAFIPLLNAVLLLKIAKKPLWWLILLFLPIVNLVVLIVATMAVCERFGMNKWYGLLAILSPFNLILYLYIAFAKTAAAPAGTPPAAPPADPPAPPAAPQA